MEEAIKGIKILMCYIRTSKYDFWKYNRPFDTKSSKLERKSPAMKEKLEVPKERKSEGSLMRNENDMTA